MHLELVRSESMVLEIFLSVKDLDSFDSYHLDTVPLHAVSCWHWVEPNTAET